MRILIDIFFLLAFFFVIRCNNSDNKVKVESKGETSDSIVSTHVRENKNDSIPFISGSCENGREIGNLDQYSIKMKVGTSPTDSIHVRSDASCFEIKRCHHNILGKIKSGTIIYAQGPLKNRDFSAGIAYAFPVKDKNGNICRAYLSYLNVERIETTHIKE